MLFFAISGAHFYPRSPCGERRYTVRRLARLSYFYPRSPCGERPLYCPPFGEIKLFLSTLSLRRATGLLSPTDPRQTISIHALLAESDHVGAGTIQTPSQISIHALLAESDQLRFLHNLFAVLFLSTLSLRRATRTKRLGFRQTSTISIHALLAESDRISLDGVGVILISIHALLAESDSGVKVFRRGNDLFLSTLSLRRATK